MQPDYLSHDTILALAAPTGGAISIIRVSGPETKRIVSSLFLEKQVPATEGKREKKKLREDQRLFRVQLVHPQTRKKLDDALCVFYTQPKSYTGEDLAELHIHGSSFVALQVIGALTEQGGRLALPGEFSFRAVRNGKMDLTQAQAVADLIQSTNTEAAALALEKLEGSQRQWVSDLAEKLRTLTSLSELGIDFSDQEVELLALPRLKAQLKEIKKELIHLRDSFSRGVKIQEGIRVAFIGRPNSGKSTLFNALLGEDRAIVSDIAGTTRDTLSETITLQSRKNEAIQSVTFRLEDTAGIRELEERAQKSGDWIEGIGIRRSLESAQKADLILFLLDLSDQQALQADQVVWNQIEQPKEKTILVLTKSDLVSRARVQEKKKELESWGFAEEVALSAKQQEGLQDLVDGMVRLSSRWTHRKPGEVLLTRLEQKEAVCMALTHIERGLSAQEEDLFAHDIRQALVALSPVMGETPTEDLLGRIFSQFCIGK